MLSQILSLFDVNSFDDVMVPTVLTVLLKLTKMKYFYKYIFVDLIIHYHSECYRK